MSATTVYIQTRGFTDAVTGQPLPATSLLTGLADLPPDQSLYEAVKVWTTDHKQRPGVMVSSSGGLGAGRGGYKFVPGESQNLDDRAMVEYHINDISRYLNLSPALTTAVMEMIRRTIFGRRRSRGMWEILWITETAPGQVPLKGGLGHRVGPSTCEFKMAVLRIQRHRDTFADRFITTRGVGCDWHKIDGTYDPTNAQHNLVEKLLDF